MLDNKLIELTREIAQQSPCIRRKYGCLITNSKDTVVTCNLRVSKCCNGTFCIRDYKKLPHGVDVNFGAEIHAEQAALIKWKFDVDKHTKVILQGFDSEGNLLSGVQLYPCHTCALMLKYAGFKFVNLTDILFEIIPVSIDEIIEYWEKSWTS